MERKVLTYRDKEEAGKYHGKTGLFSDSLEQIETGKASHRAILWALVSVPDREYKQYFYSYGGGKYQFFSPDPQPVEKWVPFTTEDWALFIGKPIRFKTDPASGCRIITSAGKVDVFANQWKLYEELLDKWEFMDGTPCGKKITEK